METNKEIQQLREILEQDCFAFMGCKKSKLF